MSIKKLEAEVLTLSAEERARLAHKIIASIEDRSDGDVAGAWIREIDRRAEQIMRGEVELVPGDEVFRKAFERLRTK